MQRLNREVREKLEKDPNPDMSHEPGTCNPGNQAGKDAQSGGNALPMSRKGRSWEGRMTVKRRKENPRQSGTPARKK
jgi:hypothetical protein